MTKLPPYRPISCDFHDVLEATATRRAPATIEHLSPAGRQARAYARIADIVTRGDGEYLVLASGEAIRLDRVVSVDGVRRSDFHD
jgi:Rho-binding antiterminator